MKSIPHQHTFGILLMTHIAPQSFRRILHPTDFTHGSEIAFVHALRLACAIKGALTILHVDRAGKHPDWDRYPSVRDTLARWNLLPPDAARTDVEKLGVHIGKLSIPDSSPAHGVLSYLENHSADLIVLATHQRHGLDRWIHTNVAGTINSGTEGATLFIPFGKKGFVDELTGESRLRRILIPVDHEPHPSVAARAAADLVRAITPDICEIQLLYVGDEASAPAVHLINEPKANWIWTYQSGSPVNAILETAEIQEPDLIVMATSGRHGFLDALRGSTTEQIVERSPCPVLAIHPRSE